MLQFTQNNKIALAAVSIFLVSFVSMLVFVDSGTPSPDFIRSNVLDSTLHEKEKGHSVYFSGDDHQTESSHEPEDSDASSGFDALEASYRELSNQNVLPIFVLEPSGKVKFLSKNFTKGYGYELKEMKEKTFFSYVHGEDLPDFVSAYTDVLNSGKTKSGIGPYRFKNEDGTTSVQVASMIPVVNDAGKVSEIITYVKDITSALKSFAEDAVNSVGSHAKDGA